MNLIEFIKNLFIYDNSIYTERLYNAHYYVIFDTIRKIKIYLKEMAKNPQCAEDTKAQLEFLVNKNKLLETKIIEMNSKIKNVQTAYFDTLNDAETLQKEICVLKEKNKELENKIKNNTKIIYQSIPVEYY